MSTFAAFSDFSVGAVPSLDSLDELDFQTLDLLGGLFEDPTFDFTLPASTPVMLPAAPSSFKRVVEPAKLEQNSSATFEFKAQEVVQDRADYFVQPTAWNAPTQTPTFTFGMPMLTPPSTTTYQTSYNSCVASPSSHSTSFDDESDSYGDSSSFSDSKLSPSFLDNVEGVEAKRRGRKRKAIPEEERVRMNRQRNREHARSTRMRKKQHIDQLKQEVADLLLRRQQLAAEPRRALNVMDCARNVTSLLELRFGGVTDQKQWAALTTPDFELQLPAGLLPGQDLHLDALAGHIQADGTRVLRTFAHIAQDVSHLQQFVQSLQLALPAEAQSTADCFHFGLFPLLDSQTIIMTGGLFMCSWTLNLQTLSSNIMAMDGMLECTFAPDGRIRKLVLVYDLLSIGRQIQELRQAKLQRLQDASRASYFQMQQLQTQDRPLSCAFDLPQQVRAPRQVFTGPFLPMPAPVSQPFSVMSGNLFGLGAPMVAPVCV